MGQWIKDYKVSMKTKIVSCEKYQEREHDSCDLIAKMQLLKTFIEWLMKNEKYMAELCIDLIECCFIQIYNAQRLDQHKSDADYNEIVTQSLSLIRKLLNRLKDS